jgi:hypothetical protein
MSDRSWDDHKKQVSDWVESTPDPVTNGNDLNEALYSLCELGLVEGCIDSIDEALAIQCWKIVERLRKERFPSDLRM